MKYTLASFTIMIWMLIITKASAQNAVNTGLQTGVFYTAKPKGFMLNTSGIFVGYELDKHWEIKAAYNRWLDILHTGITGTHEMYVLEDTHFANWKPGTITGRWNYNMLDFGIGYRTALGKHCFFVNAGPGFAFGEDDVIVTADVSSFETLATSKHVNNHYWGAMYEAGYNYAVLHSRGSIGLAFSGRKYFNAFSQHSINLQLAYKIPVRH